MLNKPRIAFVSIGDARSRQTLSGAPFYMAKSLSKYCGEVHPIPVSGPHINVALYITKALSLLSSGKIHYRHLEVPLVAKINALLARPQVEKLKPDIVFAPGGSPIVAHLKTHVPIVYASDATFELMLDYYPNFTGLSKRAIENGHALERLAIDRASLILYSTDWAAQSAIHYYEASPIKVRVTPYGANFDYIPLREEVMAHRSSRTPSSESCRLLFIGFDWLRKGGQIAYDCFLALNKMEVNAELTICGCVPPFRHVHERVTVIPSLNKNNEKDMKRLKNLFLSADFVILPTRAECSPHVFCEAGAYGLPVITTDTGGVSYIVEDGVSGYTLPLASGGVSYAKAIYRFIQGDNDYTAFSTSARNLFDNKYNWDQWGLSVSRHMREVIGL